MKFATPGVCVVKQKRSEKKVLGSWIQLILLAVYSLIFFLSLIIYFLFCLLFKFHRTFGKNPKPGGSINSSSCQPLVGDIKDTGLGNRWDHPVLTWWSIWDQHSSLMLKA